MRVPEIEGRFVRLFSELGVELVVLRRGEWERLDLEPRFRFGYAPPTQAKPDAPVMVRCSPELIDLVTAGMPDESFDLYLTTVETFVAAHLMLPDASSDEVTRWVENELMTDASACLRLVSETEMLALDAGIA